MGKPEGQIESYLIKQAKKYGFLYYKFTAPGRNGVPDRILIGHGHTIFIELKRPGGKLRELQEEIINDMKSHGAEVYVLDTKSAVDNLINKFIY